MNIRHVVLAFSISCLAAIPAMAEEHYPSGIRTITATDATSTCIGTPKTPICATETALACYIRGNPDLCTAIGAPPPGNSPKSSRETYRITSQRFYRTKQGTPEERAKIFAEVVIESIDPDPERFIFVLLKRTTHWDVVNEGAEGIIGELNQRHIEYIDDLLEEPTPTSR